MATRDRDSRKHKETGEDIRASRSREEAEAAVDERAPLVSQEGFDRMFKDEFNFEALPDPNKGGDPNFHYFWATTTNTQDTPYRRIRMGYQLVRSEERPEFAHLRLKAGEFEGIISMNEMILMKIPNELYQKFMQELHHHRPNDEEAKLAAMSKLGVSDSRGNPLDLELKEDEGYRELGKSRRAPTHFE